MFRAVRISSTPGHLVRVALNSPAKSNHVKRISLLAMGGFFSSPETEVKNFHELSALDIDKNEVNFSKFDGKVLLVANVASK